MKDELFKPEAVAAFQAEAAKLLKKQMSDFEPTIRNIKSELKGIERSEENLISAIVEQPEMANLDKVSKKFTEL
ncbi:MAG: hypothetical protein ABW185_22900 [Sedimenticola sp.]